MMISPSRAGRAVQRAVSISGAAHVQRVFPADSVPEAAVVDTGVKLDRADALGRQNEDSEQHQR